MTPWLLTCHVGDHGLSSRNLAQINQRQSRSNLSWPVRTQAECMCRIVGASIPRRLWRYGGQLGVLHAPVSTELTAWILIIIHTFLSRHKVVTSEAVAAQVRSCHYCPLLWARWNKWVLSLDLKTVSEVLSRTVLGSEFHTAGAEWWKARPAKSVLMEDLGLLLFATVVKHGCLLQLLFFMVNRDYQRCYAAFCRNIFLFSLPFLVYGMLCAAQARDHSRRRLVLLRVHIQGTANLRGVRLYDVLVLFS